MKFLRNVLKRVRVLVLTARRGKVLTLVLVSVAPLDITLLLEAPLVPFVLW